jgi:hypothetical protein
MKRCLTDRALTRVLAELGKPDEHAHLAVCRACAARYRRLQNEMTEIADVLAATPGPRVRTIPGARDGLPPPRPLPQSSRASGSRGKRSPRSRRGLFEIRK